MTTKAVHVVFDSGGGRCRLSSRWRAFFLPGKLLQGNTLLHFRSMLRRLLPALVALATALPASAQYKMESPAGEAPGPWLLGTIGVGKGPDGKPLTTALKGLAIKLGEKGEAGIAYDLDLCRVAGVWTGGKFVTPMNLMSRGEYPTALGDVVFTTEEAPGFLTKSGGDWKQLRSEPFGPLPAGQPRFKGFHVNGTQVVLRWEVGGKEVLEKPEWRSGSLVRVIEGTEPVAIPGVKVETSQELHSLITGGAPHWPDAIETTGDLSPDSTAAYVVDTVKIPDPNPWKAPLFLGGLDFFADGRAAVCTFHGDVFLVSGLSGDLKKVTWRRFASGLYHALGLKIVKDEIYVTCRDGLWRLRDLNGDGECDSYEAFNFDVKVTKSFHEFVFDLQSDPQGNFYFAKAGPVKNGGRGFDEIMAHHGSLMRVSPDGAKLEVVATGFRAPNGIGCGPDGQLTTGDNEGTWTPACKVNWIKPGGFYGVVPLSHRDPLPTDYDRPLCWLPKRIDNSGGGQVWVPDNDKWGPWRGQLLHLSYGHCALYGVMHEEVAGQIQGGVSAFPVKFQSGSMRARFHPQDGQLWVAGLRGWQTDGIKNGCLQRVRYTGAPVRMPMAIHAKKDGIELQFACSLDTQAAADPQNWNVEVWNYLWSSAYGSPELSTLGDTEKPAELGKDGAMQFTKAQISKAKHDPLEVKRISIGTDDRTVFLEIPGLKPVMQMSIRYGIKAADGAELKGEVINTIHNLAQ